jgi:ketosteroid isomerase-like protein
MRAGQLSGIAGDGTSARLTGIESEEEFMSDAETRNEGIVRTFFETLSTGNLERLRLLLHEDATWTGMATGIQGAVEKKGRKAIIDEFLGPVRGIFVDGDPKVLIQHLILQGPYAAVEAKGLGKFKNGKDYNNRYAFMIEIKDDKVFALREYMDSYYVSTL